MLKPENLEFISHQQLLFDTELLAKTYFGDKKLIEKQILTALTNLGELITETRISQLVENRERDRGKILEKYVNLLSIVMTLANRCTEFINFNVYRWMKNELYSDDIFMLAIHCYESIFLYNVERSKPLAMQMVGLILQLGHSLGLEELEVVKMFLEIRRKNQ